MVKLNKSRSLRKLLRGFNKSNPRNKMNKRSINRKSHLNKGKRFTIKGGNRSKSKSKSKSNSRSKSKKRNRRRKYRFRGGFSELAPAADCFSAGDFFHNESGDKIHVSSEEAHVPQPDADLSKEHSDPLSPSKCRLEHNFNGSERGIGDVAGQLFGTGRGDMPNTLTSPTGLTDEQMTANLTRRVQNRISNSSRFFPTDSLTSDQLNFARARIITEFNRDIANNISRSEANASAREASQMFDLDWNTFRP